MTEKELIKLLIKKKTPKLQREKAWRDILKMGAEIRKKFNIKSEEDVLEIIDD